jgi:hypothetical protein
MKVSEHLAAFHKTAANHHGTLAKCYGKLAGFGKAAKPKDEDSEGLEECLQKIADSHAAQAAFHKEAMEACSKAAEAADLVKKANQVEPLPAGISAVAPERTQGVRMVPRTGQVVTPADKANLGKIGGVDFLGLKEMDEL